MPETVRVTSLDTSFRATIKFSGSWNGYNYVTDPNSETDPSGLDPQNGQVRVIPIIDCMTNPAVKCKTETVKPPELQPHANDIPGVGKADPKDLSFAGGWRGPNGINSGDNAALVFAFWLLGLRLNASLNPR